MAFTVSWPDTRAPRGRAEKFPLGGFMLRMLRFAAAALLALAVPLVAAKEREVSIGLQSPVTSMDPHYHNLSPNNSLLLHVYDPLVYRDANGKLSPGLAVSWKP